MTTQVKPHTIALIGGPLNAHMDGEHVMRSIDRIEEEGLPQRITATPAGMFFDMEIPPTVGRYERAEGEDVMHYNAILSLPVPPEAIYVWTAPST